MDIFLRMSQDIYTKLSKFKIHKTLKNKTRKDTNLTGNDFIIRILLESFLKLSLLSVS